MTPQMIITSGLLVLISLFFVLANSANLDPGEPLFPTKEERAAFTFGLLSIACAFAAGALL